MIKVDSITISEFRGIRDMTLKFAGANYGICGPNGTGKSGIVDALEFALTGRISRLSGEGRGNVSINDHAPHVDQKDHDKARVKLVLTLIETGKSITIERSVKRPKAKATPDDSESKEVVRRLEQFGECVLSRREIMRYVLAPPKNRAELVQSLLNLEQVEQARANFLKISNALERDALSAKRQVGVEDVSIRDCLSIADIKPTTILNVINPLRQALGLELFSELTPTTALNDGIDAHPKVKPQSIQKAQAAADISAATRALDRFTDGSLSKYIAEISEVLTAISATPEANAMADREGFYATGLKYLADSACPLCDQVWDIAKLRIHLQEKIERLQRFTVLRRKASTKAQPVAQELERTVSALKQLQLHAGLADPTIDLENTLAFIETCSSRARQIADILPITNCQSALNAMTQVPMTVRDEIAALTKYVATLPDPSQRDTARTVLTIAQERLGKWREARRALVNVEENATRAKLVSTTFEAASQTVLRNLYEKVQSDFARFYKILNPDEADFSATFSPGGGRLDLTVDFFQRGQHPPSAFHSEGHQDSMGLCLYLALMRYLRGKAFSFAVLDDVVMSVDADHRRDVCELLRREFPNTQFVITTHDKVWYRQMQFYGIINRTNGRLFRSWSVDAGPTAWDDRDIWQELQDNLDRNEVRAAAATLRHYVEFVAAELCDRLRASVPYHADGQYTLGDLYFPAVAKLKDLYKLATASARSWKRDQVVIEITARADAFGKLFMPIQEGGWPVNAAVHYNEWANLTSRDFTPIVKAYHDVFDAFAGSTCKDLYSITPQNSEPESLRCRCAQTNYNLVKAKAGEVGPPVSPTQAVPPSNGQA